ncbi:hypothetical protein SCHPADRAFT_538954 [Schizopora paradoxa]|uniref:F-box domain-containing protein n=1 Tax=Schizopora paradoxa TaxID=27342 RepID=A0A0H2RDV3_9AGAM|nr:hypothetical protein SCHPADRAFT_538954 [Schizopora paradoxa]
MASQVVVGGFKPKNDALSSETQSIGTTSQPWHYESQCPWTFYKNFPDLRFSNLSIDELRSLVHTTEDMECSLKQTLHKFSLAVRVLNWKFADEINKARFCTMPDDVLAIILEMVCEDNSYAVNKLMLVCRRFRQMLISLPNLWSSLDSISIRSVKKLELLVSRATAPTISLSIFGARSDGEKDRARALGMFNLTASISLRIRTMYLHLSQYDLAHLQQVTGALSSLSLPFLAKLHLSASVRIGRESSSLTRDWDMPSLRKLTVIDLLPELSLDVMSKIETLSVTANVDYTLEEDHRYWRTNEIVAFLEGMTFVKKLSVSVRLHDNYTAVRNPAPMRSVEHLSLGLRSLDAAMGLTILHIFDFPAMTAFELRLGLPALEHLEDALNRVLASFGDPNPRDITDLTLFVGREFNRNLVESPPVPLKVIKNWCGEFGKLKSLKLEHCSLRPMEDALFSFSGNLESLKLVNSEEGVVSMDCLDAIPRHWDYDGKCNAVLDTAQIPYRDPLTGLKDIAKFK